MDVMGPSAAIVLCLDDRKIIFCLLQTCFYKESLTQRIGICHLFFKQLEYITTNEYGIWYFGNIQSEK